MSKTRQEIFDIAYRGLASQGFERSAIPNGHCLYFGPDGRRCAIGWNLPDNLPSGSVDGVGYGLYDAMADADISEDEFDFAEALQAAHDDASNTEDMKARMAMFAAHYNLTIPEVSP